LRNTQFNIRKFKDCAVGDALNFVPQSTGVIDAAVSD
jgi:hypothetical protein